LIVIHRLVVFVFCFQALSKPSRLDVFRVWWCKDCLVSRNREVLCVQCGGDPRSDVLRYRVEDPKPT